MIGRFLGVAVLLGCAAEANLPDTLVIPESVDNAVSIEDSGPEITVLPGPCAGLAESAGCDDQNVCTLGDHCVEGFCVAAGHLSCEVGTTCGPILCDPVGGCVTRQLPDGAPCGAPCFSASTCRGGLCEGAPDSAIPCPNPSDPCVAALQCDQSLGSCTVPELALACPSDSRCFQGDDGGLDCLQNHTRLCQPCLGDADCLDPTQPERAHRCLIAPGGEGLYCGSECGDGVACPAGYACDASQASPQCVPDDGTCRCDALWASLGLETSCFRQNALGTCAGRRRCAPGGLTPCDAPEPRAEQCNGLDDDCDGAIDEELGDVCGPEGACCLPDGTCGTRYYQSCLVLGGRFAGGGLSCNQAACGVAPGACCGAGCLSLLPLECAATYHGDGTTCSDTVCGQAVPQGACCLPSGECLPSSPAAGCLAAGGYFPGDGLQCAEAACEPTGACCLAGNACVSVGASTCALQGGNFEADSACLGASCPIPSGYGACCSDAGACVVTSASECKSQPGQFLAAQPCAGQCQGPALGACCNINGLCSMLAVGDCDATFATWAVPPNACPDACAAPKGACCVGFQCYPGLSAAQCVFLNGSWLGEGIGCEGGCP